MMQRSKLLISRVTGQVDFGDPLSDVVSLLSIPGFGFMCRQARERRPEITRRDIRQTLIPGCVALASQLVIFVEQLVHRNVESSRPLFKCLNAWNRVTVLASTQVFAYLPKLDRDGKHDCVIEGDLSVLSFQEGFWEKFSQSPERLAQIEANRISYAWDELIDKFAYHAMTKTREFTTKGDLRDEEIMFRFLAREDRTARRALATSL